MANEDGKKTIDNMTPDQILREAIETGSVELWAEATKRGASITLDRMLAESAFAGHIVMCVHAIDLGATDYNTMLYRAAEGAREDICELALSKGADPEQALSGAAHGRRAAMCRFARERGAHNWERMLSDSAAAGWRVGCMLAIMWGAKNVLGMFRIAVKCGYVHLCDIAHTSGLDANTMLNYAAQNNNVPFCEAAKGFGADRFENMLRVGASMGHADICRLAHAWGARDLDYALRLAGETGRTDIIELIRKLGVTDSESMLAAAAANGHIDVCRLARRYGATKYNQMLLEAARHGHAGICELAREWGANDWDGMLKEALWAKHYDICALAVKWGADNTELLELFRSVDGSK